jgi:hypothetical protein
MNWSSERRERPLARRDYGMNALTYWNWFVALSCCFANATTDDELISCISFYDPFFADGQFDSSSS